MIIGNLTEAPVDKKKITTIEGLAEMVAKTMASKNDLARFATKDDLGLMASKDDLSEMAKKMASKDDLSEMAKKMASKEDLGLMASKKDLVRFATKEDF